MSASIDPTFMAKRSDLNPPEKSKIPIKHVRIFWPVSNFYTLITRMLAYLRFEIMELSQNYDLSGAGKWLRSKIGYICHQIP